MAARLSLRHWLPALLFILAVQACEAPAPFQSQAEEVFPPVPIRSAALYSAGRMPLGPAFFKGRWTAVLFDRAACPGECPQRLKLINEQSREEKRLQALFVATDLPDHAQLRLLGETHPELVVGMGTTAQSFAAFTRQFNGEAEPLPQRIYLVNPQGEVAATLDLTAGESASLAEEIAHLNQL